MKLAKKRCRKLRCGEVPFSKALNKLRGRIKLWNWVCKLNQGASINRARIKRLAKGVEVIAPLSVTLEQARRYKVMAEAEYYKHKPSSRKWRDEELQTAYARAGERGDHHERSKIRRKIQCERARETARRIRWANKGSSRGGVTKVEHLTCDKAEDCECRVAG